MKNWNIFKNNLPLSKVISSVFFDRILLCGIPCTDILVYVLRRQQLNVFHHCTLDTHIKMTWIWLERWISVTYLKGNVFWLNFIVRMRGIYLKKIVLLHVKLTEIAVSFVKKSLLLLLTHTCRPLLLSRQM